MADREDRSAVVEGRGWKKGAKHSGKILNSTVCARFDIEGDLDGNQIDRFESALRNKERYRAPTFGLEPEIDWSSSLN